MQTMMNFLAYADGTNDLIDISSKIGASVADIDDVASRLRACGLIEELDYGRGDAI